VIAVSNDFKKAMKQPIKELDAYIMGDVTIKSEDNLISFKISCDSGMCKSAMRKLEAKYLGEHNLLGQWVRVGYGVKLPAGTFEYLDYGSFLVTEITIVKDTGVTTIVGYDQMVNSMKEYTKLEAEYPIKLIDYTRLLCEACGLELGNTKFGKNLFDGEFELGYIDISTGEDKYTTTNIRTKNYQAILPNTKYTISSENNVTRWALFYDINKNYLGYTQISNITAKGTITSIDNAYYLKWYLVNYADINHKELLEENNVSTPYVPYNQMNDWEINQELWENINGITYRDILVQIAQATGTTCIIGNDDKVYFKSLNNTGEQLTYDNMKKLKLEPKYGEINSLVLSRTPQEDNKVERDEDSIQANGLTEYKIENNEIIDKDRDNAMTPIWEALRGISYYPFETTTEGLGWYEIADSFDIVNDTGDVFSTSLFNYTITVDGAIKEILKTVADTKTQTQYQYATGIAKRVKNTEIIVDKQGQKITDLVEDMYEEEGIVNKNFTKVEQDIKNIINSVQNSGGNNLIKNSVMFAYDSDNNPKEWDIVGTCDNEFNFNALTLETGTVDYTNKTITVNQYANRSLQPLKELVPSMKAGETYTLTLETTGDNKFIYLLGSSTVWLSGKSHKITQAELDDHIYVYGNYQSTETVVISNIKINKGDSDGTLFIDSNTESLTAGGLSGHSFTLSNKIASQKVAVGTGNQYTFSTKIKKDTTGSCYVKLYNSNEEYIINLSAGENVFYKEYEIKDLIPKEGYYIIEFYGSADSGATFTDNMLSLGNYKTPWQQANGEVMNTQVNINLEGVLVKSSVYLGDYTVMSPLEFAGYSNINGTITKVFSLNKDVTLVKKLEAEDEVKMVPIKVVPITSGDLQGWAFVPSN